MNVPDFLNIIPMFCSGSEGPEARIGGVPQAGGRAAHRSILQSVVERVSGGKDAQKGEFPWMARIDLPQGSCGGILVTPSQVLTAAHCLEPFDRDDVLDDARVSIGQGDSGSCRSCETFRIDVRVFSWCAIYIYILGITSNMSVLICRATRCILGTSLKVSTLPLVLP
jgi:hypothetical protein